MTVDVTKESNSSWIECFDDHSSSCIDFRMIFIWRISPLSIQINCWDWASVVPNNNAIRVKHWNNFKNKFISQFLGIRVVTDQELNDSLHNEAWIWFSWMNSSTYNNSRSFCNVFFSGIKVCNNKHFAVISRKSFTHWSFSYSISILSCTNRVDKWFQIRIRVWITMSNINFIKIISKLKIKRKTIIIVLPFFVLLLLSVLVIANVFTISMPTIVHSFGLLSWIHKRKHTLIV